MCLECNDRGIKEFDYLKMRLDALPKKGKMPYVQMMGFFESLGNPNDRHFTICKCRSRGGECWNYGPANGCRPIPDMRPK